MTVIEYSSPDNAIDIEQANAFMSALLDSGIMPESAKSTNVAAMMLGIGQSYSREGDFGHVYQLLAISLDMLSSSAKKHMSKEDMQAVATAIELLCAVSVKYAKDGNMRRAPE